MVLDRLAHEWAAPLGSFEKWGARLGENRCAFLVKPANFHESQRSAAFWRSRTSTRSQPEEILVVLDDLALPLGRLRLRRKAVPADTTDSNPIFVHFGTEAIPRLRVGIGAAPSARRGRLCPGPLFRGRTAGRRKTIERAAEAVKCAIDKGVVSCDECFQQTIQNYEESLRSLARAEHPGQR